MASARSDLGLRELEHPPGHNEDAREGAVQTARRERVQGAVQAFVTLRVNGMPQDLGVRYTGRISLGPVVDVRVTIDDVDRRLWRGQVTGSPPAESRTAGAATVRLLDGGRLGASARARIDVDRAGTVVVYGMSPFAPT
jgi:hypothetical protein